MLKKFISSLIAGGGIVAAIKIFIAMFIGGIITIAGALDAGTINFTIIAINALKIIFSTFIAGIILYASIIIGAVVSIR